MYEDNNERQFDNSGTGRSEQDSQNRPLFEPDRTHNMDLAEDTNEGNDAQINSGLKNDLNNLQAVPKNNDFSSRDQEDQLDEETNLDLEEEDMVEDDITEDDMIDDETIMDDDEEMDQREYGDENSTSGNPDTRRVGF